MQSRTDIDTKTSGFMARSFADPSANDSSPLSSCFRLSSATSSSVSLSSAVTSVRSISSSLSSRRVSHSQREALTG